MRTRVPGLAWPPGRIALVIADHPRPDALEVAGACADWLAFKASRVQDGPAAYRTFMERASHAARSERKLEEEPAVPADLSDYDRFEGA